MRTRPFALLLVAAAALAPAVALAGPSVPTPGPFVGVVAQGGTAEHVYNDHPPEGCPDWFAPVGYTLTLQYQPPTDRLTVSVPGRGVAVGVNGLAALSWEGPGCDAFTVTVEGTRVAVLAVYEASVLKGASAPPAS